MPPSPATTIADHRVLDRVAARLLPLLGICYFVAYLDRVNVSFAALTMNRDLGISSSQYGLAAGVFFLTYFGFEIPSNLILTRVGARRWIARIMVTWGLLSAAMALVSGPRSFIALRLLLGAAEAGFFPGVIFYLTAWFPAATRARIIGRFMAAIPLSTLIGAPISTALLSLDGAWGWRGWQWLFVIEALPAVLLAIVVWRVLPDGPNDARWLSADDRATVQRLLTNEQRPTPNVPQSLRSIMTNPRVLALSVIYFGVAALIYGIGFFLPLLLSTFDVSAQRIGWLAVIPYSCGFLGALTWPRRSDRLHERRWHLLVPFGTALIALLAAAFTHSLVVVLIAVSAVAWATFAAAPVFWTLPTSLLTGTAAAAGIALVNAIGNLAGFVGPYAMGALKQSTGGYRAGLLTLAAVVGVSLLLVTATVPASRRR
jgi:MFS transporter, ACS family, tartrate transporter